MSMAVRGLRLGIHCCIIQSTTTGSRKRSRTSRCTVLKIAVFAAGPNNHAAIVHGDGVTESPLHA